MKYKVIFSIAFVFIALIVAFAIKPKTNEMLYVYEKSNNLEKANSEYKKILEESPNDLDTLRKFVDNLYATRDKNYIVAAVEYYKKDKDYVIVRRIIDGFKSINDFENSLLWLKTAYNDFEKIDDLKEFLQIAAFISKKESQIYALKELYKLTNDKSLLFTLYGLNDKEFALNELYKIEKENKLNQDELVTVLKHSIYEKKFNKAYEIYQKYELIDLKPYENEKEYNFLLTEYGKIEDLDIFYEYLFINNRNEKYFEQYKNFLITEGDIDKYLELNKYIFSKTKNKKILDEIIQYSFLNEDIEEYLDFLSKKAIEENDIVTSESIIAYYIDIGEKEKLDNFLNKLSNLSSSFDEYKKLVVKTYVYLEENEKAKDIFLKFSPKEVSPDLAYDVFNRKINEESMPYFMEALKNSNDNYTKGKLFRYRYKTLKLFSEETYEYFGKPTTVKKLMNYLIGLTTEEKILNIIKFATDSEDPQFISESARELMYLNQLEDSKKLLNQALKIYPNNKLALKTLGYLYFVENKLDLSLEHFTKLKTLDSLDYEIDYYLGNIYLFKKDEDNYIKNFVSVIKNLKADSIDHRYMILKAKSIVDKSNLDITEFNKLYNDSENNVNTLADIWSIFLQNRDFPYLIKEFEIHKTLISQNSRLQDIEIDTYIAMKKEKIAKSKLIEILDKEKQKIRLSTLHEKVAVIELDNSNKKEALEHYEKSIENRPNSEISTLIETLRKNFRTSLSFSVGIRNKIEEGNVELKHTFKKVKIYLINDIFDSYNSAKIIVTDLNEKVKVGLGKDYKMVSLNNFLHKNLSIFFEEKLDSNSKTTIKDALKYKSFGLDYTRNFFDSFYYNLKLTNFDYDNFDRKRVENIFYIPLKETYFSTFSHVYEKVDKTNLYGYEDLNKLILAIGDSDKIDKNWLYYISIGSEIDSDNVNWFGNLNFIFESKDSDLSINNSFSKDTLTNEYNFTNILQYKYYF